MIWVLILSLTGGQRAAIATHEFNSHEACINAGQAIIEKTRQQYWDADPSYVCAPKDVLSPVR